MARYKDVCYEQDKFIPIRFSKQILPGTFEYTLCYLVEHVIDTSVFDGHYVNDETGAPAYDPEVLLKIVCYAYSRGIISSREIARACRENVVFMALSADTHPHYTTIASFISHMSDVNSRCFRISYGIAMSLDSSARRCSLSMGASYRRMRRRPGAARKKSY